MLLIFLIFCVVLCFCVLFVFVLCLMYPMLPFSLDCPFVIAPSVFSNVYLVTHNSEKNERLMIKKPKMKIMDIYHQISQNLGHILVVNYNGGGKKRKKPGISH